MKIDLKTHPESINCHQCDEFDRGKYYDKYPKKCNCGGNIHHEVICRGWDRVSYAWSLHGIKCDKCGTFTFFDIDFDFKKSIEDQYFEGLNRYREKYDKL